MERYPTTRYKTHKWTEERIPRPLYFTVTLHLADILPEVYVFFSVLFEGVRTGFSR